MQVVQRGVLQRIGLLIGRNRDDDRPIDLADRELVGLKPAEIERVAGSIEILVDPESLPALPWPHKPG